MITIIGNLKGGSGKSTVAFNLAVWLACKAKTVVLYDLDPQCTLSDVAQIRAEEHYEPALKVYTRYTTPTVETDDYEVLIDVGTANMAAMKRALALADRIVIPVPPSQADIWSTQRFLYIIASIKRDKPANVLTFINRADTHKGVPETNEAEAALRLLPGITVLESRLHQRTVYRRSFSEGLGVFELEPSSKATQEFNQFAKQLYPL